MVAFVRYRWSPQRVVADELETLKPNPMIRELRALIRRNPVLLGDIGTVGQNRGKVQIRRDIENVVCFGPRNLFQSSHWLAFVVAVCVFRDLM